MTETQSGNFIQVKLDVINPEEIDIYDQAPVKVFVTTATTITIINEYLIQILAIASYVGLLVLMWWNRTK